MPNDILAFLVFSGLCFLLIISVVLGRHYGQWKIKYDPIHKLEVVTVAEGAVFALLGLLIAFTFTGAYERFEARKVRIVEEANYIDVAYLRLDLLAPQTKAPLEQTYREYVNSRIGIYEKLSARYSAENEIEASIQLQKKVWHETLAALQVTNNQAVTQLIIPAVNDMIDIANTRLALTQIHPPMAIFLLLIGLAMASTFLAGYATARKKFIIQFI